MRKIGFVIILLLCASKIYGQVITGEIIDGISKKRIAYSYIHDNISEVNVVSDKEGKFIFDTKGQDVVLMFDHISYKCKIENINCPIKDTSIIVVLDEKFISLDGAEVVEHVPLIKTSESYSNISVDKDIIEDKIATSLVSVLEEVPGVTVSSEYFSPIVLRGLKGKRLLITKDGNRRMGNYSSGFMGQSVNIYDLAKVEVIKGPASVIYGPGAIGGIINLKSTYPFFNPGFTGRVLSSYGFNNNEHSCMAGMNWALMDHAVSFSCRYRNADDYINGAGEKADYSRYKDKDVRLMYSKVFDNVQFTAESELHLGGPWGRPKGFSGTDYIKLTNDNDNTWHSAITAIWNPTKKLKRLEASVYFDLEEREQIKDSFDKGSGLLSYREDISYKNYYCGWRELNVIELFENTELKVGTDGVLFRIESPTNETDYFLDTEIHNKVTKNAGVFMAGVYAEAEHYSINEKIKLRAGLRFDFSNVNEGSVHDTTLTTGRNSDVYSWSGTSSFVYKLKSNISSSLQIARSCRLPDAREMFIVTSNTDGMIYGNPNLNPEYGLNIDAGLRGKLLKSTFDFSLFCNFFNDFISLDYWTDSGKKGINYTYVKY